jgi:beta-galactosidase
MPRIGHGCDYNPEQWEDVPGVWEQDWRLMRQTGIDTVALGIFAWSRLEPSEGNYDLDWMARVIDGLHAHGVGVWLATPSGAKPNWMAERYPEIRRCQPAGNREHQAGRHNHCPTSPIYREKVAAINQRLSARFGQHPAVKLWHISNEYGGACSCPLCWTAFHHWLERKYGTVTAMNEAWWGRFWSKWFDRFDQITYVDGSVSGLYLDWKRFTSDQCADFLRAEIAAVRTHSTLPATTNLMGFYEELDSARLTAPCDVVGWDAYPDWHGSFRTSNGGERLRPFAGVTGDALVAGELAFLHDLHRGLKPGKPWLLMESVPSNLSWRGQSRLKAPGVNRLAGLQAVAHGADAVAYFQWRQGRGGCEAFHGALVDHSSREDTRVLREAGTLSDDLDGLTDLTGTVPTSQAAVLYDWEVRWQLDLNKHTRNSDKDYPGMAVAHYLPLWRRSIGCDVLNLDQALTDKRLVIAPMLYALRPGVVERLEAFVAAGGILLCTSPCGVVDQHDLAFTTGKPGPLTRLLGLRVDETDAPDDGELPIVPVAGEPLGLPAGLSAADLRGGWIADLITVTTAEVLATFSARWYSGRPALTRNRHGQGWAYFLATRGTPALIDALVAALAQQAGLVPVVADLPAGVTAHARGRRTFICNWNDHAVVLPTATVPAYGTLIR